MDINKILADFVNGTTQSNLASFRQLSNAGHLQHLTRHIRREGPKYNDVDYYVDLLKDEKIQAKTIKPVRHFVFDMGFDSRVTNQQEYDIDIEMRRIVLKSAYYRVIDRYFGDKVRLASIVGGENVDGSGAKYEMHDALHIIFEGLTKDEDISQLIGMFNLYLDVHGYTKIKI